MKKTMIRFVAMLSLLTGCANEKETTVAIIGGADGPTAVFVTGEISWFTMIGAIVAIVLIVAAIIYFIKQK